MIHLEKNKDKWRVRPTFQIKLDIRDLSLLEEIKIYFNNTGSINTSNKDVYTNRRTVLQEIISIRASMNLGLSSSVKEDFPHIIPVIRPLIENMVIPHPEWMAGFVNLERVLFCVYYIR
ncbi:unnamed protein product [Fusarium graminearum]|nr:unnamed protein product [Fusarium graminearum]